MTRIEIEICYDNLNITASRHYQDAWSFYIRQQVNGGAETDDVCLNITNRQLQTLVLQASGLGRLETAERMGVSPETVKSHLKDTRNRNIDEDSFLVPTLAEIRIIVQELNILNSDFLDFIQQEINGIVQ
jgi:hypothetical protein